MNTLALLAMTDMGAKALAAAIAILVAGAAAIGMGIAIAKALEGIARQPEADKKISKTLILGLLHFFVVFFFLFFNPFLTGADEADYGLIDQQADNRHQQKKVEKMQKKILEIQPENGGK